MSNQSIIELYTELANNPDKDFGWDTGLQNARNHGYKEAWIEAIPEKIWSYCAAVGNPFNAGEIGEGDSVLDIGCGAGVDTCVASLLVGNSGSVYGLDITPAMVEKAKHNADIAGLSNIAVIEGSFDKLPIGDGTVNIVISNGAINLAGSKEIVFSEIYRVLFNGGRLYFSDMIKDENSLDEVCCSKDSWADCVAGTLRSDELIQLLEKAGFTDAKILNTNHYKTSSSTVGATFSAKKP
jgi:SAM-dependent methyltransferase